MEKIILIKYGELTTKKGNRKQFINILNRNVDMKLKEFDVKIERTRDRMYVYNSGEQTLEVIKKLQEVFGIHAIVVAYKMETEFDTIQNNVLEIVENIKFNTFKVDTKRSFKGFPIESMEVSRLIGGYVLNRLDNISVDVRNPELLLRIEIRKKFTYVYADEYKGLGGYPVGVQGKGLLMLSGGIDSPVAGYLAMKRGIHVEGLYFESPPHTSDEAKNKVKKLAEIINEYDGKVKLHVVPFTEIQEAIYQNCDFKYMITIMRRMMYRITEQYAKKIGAKIIINGESIGQVASQTLESISVINEVTNFPIIRPVACLDKIEIIEISKKINAYTTSILPFEDCCTIFLPKQPVIHPELQVCIDNEKNFDFEKLVKKAVDNIEKVEIFTVNKKHESLL